MGAAIAMFAPLHRRAPELNWLRDPVSNYGVSPAARLFRTYGHVGTLDAALLALQFALSKSPAIPRAALVSMVLLLVFRIGVILVPTNPLGAPASRTGRLHLLFAVATFAATYTAISNATPVLAAASVGWLAAMQSCLRVVAMLSLAGVVLTMIAPLKRAFGLLEHIFLLSTMLWFVAANLAFLQTPRPGL